MEWINVKTKLPDKTDQYLVAVKQNTGDEDEYLAIRLAWFYVNWQQTESKWKWTNNLHPVWWMEIPEILPTSEAKTEANFVKKVFCDCCGYRLKTWVGKKKKNKKYGACVNGNCEEYGKICRLADKISKLG